MSAATAGLQKFDLLHDGLLGNGAWGISECHRSGDRSYETLVQIPLRFTNSLGPFSENRAIRASARTCYTTPAAWFDLLRAPARSEAVSVTWGIKEAAPSCASTRIRLQIEHARVRYPAARLVARGCLCQTCLDSVGPASPVPLPAAAWLLVSGLGGLGAFARSRVGPAALRNCLIELPDTYGMDAPTLNGIDVPKWKCWLPLKRMEASIHSFRAENRSLIGHDRLLNSLN